MDLHKYSAKYWPAPACEDTVSGQGKNHMEELEGTALSTLTGPGVVSAPIGQSATIPLHEASEVICLHCGEKLALDSLFL